MAGLELSLGELRDRIAVTFERPAVRRAVLLAMWAVVGIFATLLVTILGSLLVGQKLITINSNSQAPALHDGDIALEHQVHPGDVKVGQIITFSEPKTGHQLSHRVKAIENLPGQVRILTKGDSASTFERFTVPDDGEVGVVIRRIPWIGHIADALGGPLALLLLPLAVLGVAGVVEFRRRRLRPEM